MPGLRAAARPAADRPRPARPSPRIVIEGGGAAIRGSVEVDPNGDLLNANFPSYAPSDGDKASLKVERTQDGVVRGTMRGDVFDGRGFLKSAISGNGKDDPKNKMKNVDFDIDVKLGAVAGFNGEAMRSVDAKMSRRNGAIKAFTLSGKIGRDTPIADADIADRYANDFFRPTPFTTWRFQLARDAGPVPDLDGLSAIRVQFFGEYSP